VFCTFLTWRGIVFPCIHRFTVTTDTPMNAAIAFHAKSLGIENGS
jgi:hypothetical protein